MLKIILLFWALVMFTLPYMPVLAQIPPTPTPMPPGTPRFTLPDEFSLWGGAPSAITAWQMSGPWQPVLQGLAIVGLVIIGMFIVWKFIGQMTKRDSEQ